MLDGERRQVAAAQSGRMVGGEGHASLVAAAPGRVESLKQFGSRSMPGYAVRAADGLPRHARRSSHDPVRRNALSIAKTAGLLSVALLAASPLLAAEPSDPVPVVEAPKGPVRSRFHLGAPKRPCALDDDLGTLWSGPNGASLWLPPHAQELCAPPLVWTTLPRMPAAAPKKKLAFMSALAAANKAAGAGTWLACLNCHRADGSAPEASGVAGKPHRQVTSVNVVEIAV